MEFPSRHYMLSVASTCLAVVGPVRMSAINGVRGMWVWVICSTIICADVLSSWLSGGADGGLIAWFGGRGGQSLGAEGVLPGRHIVSLLRVFEQFTHLIPSEQMLSSFKTYSPL